MNIKEMFSSLSKNSRLWAVALVLLVGIGLLVFAKAPSAKVASEDTQLMQYAMELEEKIARICSRVAGVSHVSVAVSFRGGFEYVYATDERGNIISSGGSGSIIKQKTPEIAGVGIVCVGGGNDALRERLISLVSAACGIGTNRIYVTEAKNK